MSFFNDFQNILFYLFSEIIKNSSFHLLIVLRLNLMLI